MQFLFILFFFLYGLNILAQQKGEVTYTLLKPDRVFDGQQMHNGWWVLVKGNRIETAGESGTIKAPKSAKTIELKLSQMQPDDAFLLPVNIDIVTAKGKHRVRMTPDGKESTMKVQIAKPKKIVIDPDDFILKEVISE